MADTSYFFTNFSNDVFDRDLWKFFQRWGRVLDVFISRKLNKRNLRFGFVRFQGVVDEVDMERKLDSIWIGMWKLQANLIRFCNGEVSKNERFSKKGPVKTQNAWRPKANHRSFAQVVTGEISGNPHLDSDVVQLDVNVESTSRLENCFVGRLLEFFDLQSVQKSFILGGFSVVRLRYMGE